MKLDDLRYVVKLIRQLQFVGSGNVATVSLPSSLKQLNDLKRGDLAEIIFDVRNPTECRVIFRKKEGGGQNES
jgi:phage FluMu protein gp41